MVNFQNETLHLTSLGLEDPDTILNGTTYPALDTQMFAVEILTGRTKLQDKTLFSFIKLFDYKVK